MEWCGTMASAGKFALLATLAKRQQVSYEIF